MTPRDPHPDVAEELRQLAQAILDRLDPAIRAAATRAAEGLGGPGRCQQVWCPVCALAAMVTGEQHPLLTVVAEHSVALLTVIRSMTAQSPDAGSADSAAGPVAGTDAGFNGANGAGGGYHHIPFTVEPAAASDDPRSPED